MYALYMSLSTIDTHIGARVRDLRSQRNLTLDTLANQANVSRAMLSRIERGESSPTAQLLNKVCGGLGITLSTLFAETQTPDTQTPGSPLSRRAAQATWRDPATNYLRRTISPQGTGSPVDITEIEFPPNTTVSFDSQRLTNADQHIWVLNGTLDLELGDDLYNLQTGDCLMMRFDRPILFRNPTDHPTRYAVIISHGLPRP
jgi:transcriptional regulator with XRE-family HTH domain